MTITEYLNRRYRRFRIVARVAVAACLALLTCYGYLYVVQGRDYALAHGEWLIALGIAAFVAMNIVGRALRCPFCKASLLPGKLSPAEREYRSCPHCGADFGESDPLA